jgi:hypothetical protein
MRKCTLGFLLPFGAKDSTEIPEDTNPKKFAPK